MDEVEVCRQIRTFSRCYILMVAARDDGADRLVGLSVGADGYKAKFFSLREQVGRAGHDAAGTSSDGRPVRGIRGRRSGESRDAFRELLLAGYPEEATSPGRPEDHLAV